MAAGESQRTSEYQTHLSHSNLVPKLRGHFIFESCLPGCLQGVSIAITKTQVICAFYDEPRLLSVGLWGSVTPQLPPRRKTSGREGPSRRQLHKGGRMGDARLVNLRVKSSVSAFCGGSRRLRRVHGRLGLLRGYSEIRGGPRPSQLGPSYVSHDQPTLDVAVHTCFAFSGTTLSNSPATCHCSNLVLQQASGRTCKPKLWQSS